MEQKKVYFISDAHLGSRMIEDPKQHEKRVVDWLDRIKADAKSVFLLGDMFDFWYEYKTVVPKGHVRFLGKLAELVDCGIEVHFFIGNHDIWTFGYLENEVGLIVHKQAETIKLSNKSFFLAHGDGIHSEDRGFKFIRKIFHSKTCQTLFRLIPPQIGQEFGFRWSKKNREKIKDIENRFLGEENEDLVVFAKKYIETHDVDFLIFGHRHIALDLQLKNTSRVVILGDFINIFSYGVFDGEQFRLEFEE